jgi:hypothetical protein
MIYKAKQKAARRLKGKGHAAIISSKWVWEPKKVCEETKRCAKRDDVPCSFCLSDIAVSELLLSYVKKDINLSDHNPLFYVFWYMLCVFCVDGSDPGRTFVGSPVDFLYTYSREPVGPN